MIIFTEDDIREKLGIDLADAFAVDYDYYPGPRTLTFTVGMEHSAKYRKAF